MIGFLPYRNLASRWKFLAFESWLRRKGLDPFKYKPNLGIIRNSETENNASLDSRLDQEIDQKIDVNISPDMELEDLLRIYDQEKLQFLSFYVGQVWINTFYVRIFIASYEITDYAYLCIKLKLMWYWRIENLGS